MTFLLKLMSKLILVPLILLLSVKTFAADNVTINITGRVAASSCNIDNSGTYNINLGQKIPSVKLINANSYSDWIPFNFTLSKCPTGTSSVTATFSGNADSSDTTIYANATGDEYAKNVAVQLQNAETGSNLGDKTTMNIKVASDKSVNFPLRARVYSTQGKATSGNISTTVLINLTYN